VGGVLIFLMTRILNMRGQLCFSRTTVKSRDGKVECDEGILLLHRLSCGMIYYD